MRVAPTKASSRTAKSCGPDLPTLGSSPGYSDVGPNGPDTPRSQGDGGYQARHSGESTKQPLKLSRRECRLFRSYLW